jgi:hypothetical protein
MELEKTELSDVIRNTEFGTLTNNIVLDDTEGVVETVKEVTITADIEDSGITLNTTLSSVSVSGSYEGLYNDIGKYVSKGSSDKIEEPTVFVSISDLPPNKEFYLFEQDEASSKTVTYTVNVLYDKETTTSGEGEPPPPPTVTNETDLTFTDTFTHTVNTDVTLGYNVVSSYYV